MLRGMNALSRCHAWGRAAASPSPCTGEEWGGGALPKATFRRSVILTKERPPAVRRPSVRSRGRVITLTPSPSPRIGRGAPIGLLRERVATVIWAHTRGEGIGPLESTNGVLPQGILGAGGERGSSGPRPRAKRFACSKRVPAPARPFHGEGRRKAALPRRASGRRRSRRMVIRASLPRESRR